MSLLFTSCFFFFLFFQILCRGTSQLKLYHKLLLLVVVIMFILAYIFQTHYEYMHILSQKKYKQILYLSIIPCFLVKNNNKPLFFLTCFSRKLLKKKSNITIIIMTLSFFIFLKMLSRKVYDLDYKKIVKKVGCIEQFTYSKLVSVFWPKKANKKGKRWIYSKK